MGATSHHLYDALGNEIESWVSHPLTQVKQDWWQSTYDAVGHVLVESTFLHDGSTAILQSTVARTYDGLGNELTVDDSTIGGLPAKKVYDASGNVTKEWAEGACETSYADLRATRSAYDSQGRATDAYAPGSSQPTHSDYDPDSGELAKETRPDGSFTAYAYDDAGRVIKEQAPLTGYDAQTNPTAVAETTYAYDTAGRRTKVVKPSGMTTTFTYDQLGRQLTANGGSSPSRTVYNTLGWVLLTSEADQRAVKTTYDAAGRRLGETRGTVDSQGVFTATQAATQYTYDDCGRTLSQTDPDGRIVNSHYDVFGNQDELRHTVSGTEVRHVDLTYDSLGRVITRHDTVSGVRTVFGYPVNTAGNETETLRYDAMGSAQTTITRDARRHEAQRVTVVAASPSNLTLTRSIDARDDAQRVTQATLATNSVFRTAYDGAGRISKQWGAGTTVAASTPEASVAAAYDYDPDTGLKNADALPLPTSFGGAIASTYTYDAAGRLAVATIGGLAATHTFDAAGSLKRVAQGGVTTDFTYDSGGRLTLTTGPATTLYKWNAAQGWRTSQGPSDASQPITYTYTAAGRLASYGNTAASPAAITATYGYDAAGQRTRSVVAQGSTTTTTDYRYEGLTLLGLSAATNGVSWKIDYLYDENGVVYGGVYRDPVGATSPVAFSMVATDRGDVVELLDASGSPFVAYRYDAWGNPTATLHQQTTLISDAVATDIAARQVLRYASYAYDSESGLYYCSARYYDPATRQWTTGDPAKADGEESAYQYCGGDPIDGKDTSGETAIQFNFPAHGDATSRFKDLLQQNAAFIRSLPVKHLVEKNTPNHAWDFQKLLDKDDRTTPHWKFRTPIARHVFTKTWQGREHRRAYYGRDPNSDGMEISGDDLGNINFGYTARAYHDYSVEHNWLVLTGVLAKSQAVANANTPALRQDETRDEAMIKWGWDLYPKPDWKTGGRSRFDYYFAKVR